MVEGEGVAPRAVARYGEAVRQSQGWMHAEALLQCYAVLCQMRAAAAEGTREAQVEVDRVELGDKAQGQSLVPRSEGQGEVEALLPGEVYVHLRATAHLRQADLQLQGDPSSLHATSAGSTRGDIRGGSLLTGRHQVFVPEAYRQVHQQASPEALQAGQVHQLLRPAAPRQAVAAEAHRQVQQDREVHQLLRLAVPAEQLALKALCQAEVEGRAPRGAGLELKGLGLGPEVAGWMEELEMVGHARRTKVLRRRVMK
ncbi:hypothetical protein Efla_006163 [Eimeria flavescens]